MKEVNRPTAAIYCRVALKCTQRIESQIATLTQYAHSLGFYEISYYIDNGASGLTLDRPGLRQMETAIQAGTIRAVIVADITRIGRDSCKVSNWLVELQNKGIPFFTADQPYKPVLPFLWKAFI